MQLRRRWLLTKSPPVSVRGGYPSTLFLEKYTHAEVLGLKVSVGGDGVVVGVASFRPAIPEVPAPALTEVGGLPVPVSGAPLPRSFAGLGEPVHRELRLRQLDEPFRILAVDGQTVSQHLDLLPHRRFVRQGCFSRLR